MRKETLLVQLLAYTILDKTSIQPVKHTRVSIKQEKKKCQPKLYIIVCKESCVKCTIIKKELSDINDFNGCLHIGFSLF